MATRPAVEEHDQQRLANMSTKDAIIVLKGTVTTKGGTRCKRLELAVTAGGRREPTAERVEEGPVD